MNVKRFGKGQESWPSFMPKDRILIVEDDEGLREVTTAQLEREGYETTCTASAELAIPILEQSLPQLAIVDLRLPGMSGLDLLKRIRIEHPETAVIVTTAFGTGKSAVEAMKAGACDYLPKPVQGYELKAIVKRSIEHHRLLHNGYILQSAFDRKSGSENIIV